MTTTVTTRRLTGLKPTGDLHLGNLLGAIQPMVRAQYATDSIVFLADLHALTVAHEPGTVRELTLRTGDRAARGRPRSGPRAALRAVPRARTTPNCTTCWNARPATARRTG